MTQAVYNYTRATAAALVGAPGKLLGFLVSHNQATVQTVTFYDNTAASGTVLLVVYIAPEQCPTHIIFPSKNPIQFATGLSATYTNCELSFWAVEYA